MSFQSFLYFIALTEEFGSSRGSPSPERSTCFLSSRRSRLSCPPMVCWSSIRSAFTMSDHEEVPSGLQCSVSLMMASGCPCKIAETKPGCSMVSCRARPSLLTWMLDSIVGMLMDSPRSAFASSRATSSSKASSGFWHARVPASVSATSVAVSTLRSCRGFGSAGWI